MTELAIPSAGTDLDVLPTMQNVHLTVGLKNLGIQGLFAFENGYTASVIRGPYSYGGLQGLFEVAVLDRDGHLDCDTPVTDSVIGHLNMEALQRVLLEIQALPEAPASRPRASQW